MLKLFLASETLLISQSQCVYRIVNPKEVFSVPCRFSAPDVHFCQESMVNTFTDSYPKRFTHQLLKVVCSDTSNGRSEAISPMNTARLQRCFPVPPWHQCVFLKTVFVGTFLHRRREHLTRVTSTAAILEQTPNLSFPAEVLGWYHVERNGISVPPSLQIRRNLHSPNEHVEGISDADEFQSSHSTIHISGYIWSLISTGHCLLEG